MKSALVLIIVTVSLLLPSAVLGLDPSLEITQYAHTAWTTRDGFIKGNIYAIAQTPDGYLWFGTENGLARFDGVRIIPWQPPAGQQLPDKDINSLLVTRDGTLWIGTFAGVATWKDGKLSPHPELDRSFAASLFEDRDGTVWVGTLDTPGGQLCAIRSGGKQCYGENGEFGRSVWALYEDNSGSLWAAAQTGLWRIKPGPPRQYATAAELIAVTRAQDGRLLTAVHGGGLLQLVNDKLEKYPVRTAGNSDALLPDQDTDSNRLLCDRDGGLWIGTIEHGLIHVHQGRTGTYSRANGLSGDVILSIFEDHEGNVWVSSTGGLDRFRELPVSTVSVKEGLASDASQSVLAAKDGSIWIGAHSGLTRLKDGRSTIFRKGRELPDDPESLYGDDNGILISTRRGLLRFEHGKFTALKGVPGGEVHYIAGDKAGNVWLSEHKNIFHLRNGLLISQIPWAQLGRPQSAEVLLPSTEPGGLWIGFWANGGLWFLKDGKLVASYTAADGLGEGEVGDLQLDSHGALWVATEKGGLSRIKDGRIATLSTRNGLPCDAIHWSIEDDSGAFWLYTACGLVRIARSEIEAWSADPKRSIETAVWDAADGVRIRSSAASAYGPRVTKATDGKLWFVTGEGVQVIDPHHLSFNKLPPPVHIEQIMADGKFYEVSNSLRLPPHVQNVSIDYTALSLVAPEKMHFRYKLEGQDNDWREVVNDRKVQYSNLRPGNYRFRVIACNNSGVWNEQGDTLEFYIAPAYYQTNWFRALCVISALALLALVYLWRVRELNHQFEMTLEARVGERTRIARELHDTLLQSFHGLLLRFQTASLLLPDHPAEAKERLDHAIDHAADAITEGRDAVQGLRDSTVLGNDLGQAIRTLGEELAADATNHSSVDLHVSIEGESRNLHPITRDEIYKIAAEAMRNAFRHAQAHRIEVELHYGNERFRMRVRDDGNGIDPAVLSQGFEGHYGLPGMRERATLMGGKLEVWSEINEGTEVELCVPASKAYTTARKGFWSRNSAAKA